MKIAVASGKGGTGKTFVATNLAAVLVEQNEKVAYLDCDVEAPNGHLFLKPNISKEEEITFLSPVAIDQEKCVKCGQCAQVCRYNAIAVARDKALLFPQLCRACGACELICHYDAVIKGKRKIGQIKHGLARGKIDFHYGMLEAAEGRMTTNIIQRVKKFAGPGINILDCPPGTACPVVESIKDADLSVLVTDLTPFGVHDLKLAVRMCRKVGQEPVIILNRSNGKPHEFFKQEDLGIIGEIPDDIEIAKTYSRGKLAVDFLPAYRPLFEDLARKILCKIIPAKKNI